MRKVLHTIKDQNDLEKFAKQTLLFVGHKDDIHYLDRFDKDDMRKLHDYFNDKLKAVKNEMYRNKKDHDKMAESHKAIKPLNRILIALEKKGDITPERQAESK